MKLSHVNNIHDPLSPMPRCAGEAFVFHSPNVGAATQRILLLLGVQAGQRGWAVILGESPELKMLHM